MQVVEWFLRCSWRPGATWAVFLFLILGGARVLLAFGEAGLHAVLHFSKQCIHRSLCTPASPFLSRHAAQHDGVPLTTPYGLRNTQDLCKRRLEKKEGKHNTQNSRE